MEKVTEQGKDLEVFANDIDLYLQMFKEQQNIDDLRTIPQSVWNAALIFIRMHVFPDSNILKRSEPLENYHSNDYGGKYSNLNSSTCGAYDIKKVNAVCDYYIYICMMYDKEISIVGFNLLTGISIECIYSWGNNSRKLSTSGVEIFKKLKQYREESLSNKLVTGRQNPVGTIAVLNRQFGWASPYTSDARRQERALEDQALPRLEGVQNAAIEAKNQDIEA